MKSLVPIEVIEKKILLIGGQKVMLDSDPSVAAPLADSGPKLCNACHGDRAYMRPHGGGTATCTTSASSLPAAAV